MPVCKDKHKQSPFCGNKCSRVSNNQTCWHVLPRDIFSIWGRVLLSCFELLCKCVSSPIWEFPALQMAPQKLALVPVNSLSVDIIVSPAQHPQEHTVQTSTCTNTLTSHIHKAWAFQGSLCVFKLCMHRPMYRKEDVFKCNYLFAKVWGAIQAMKHVLTYACALEKTHILRLVCKHTTLGIRDYLGRVYICTLNVCASASFQVKTRAWADPEHTNWYTQAHLTEWPC